MRESLGSSEVRNSQEGCSEELLSVFTNRSLMKKKGKKTNYCHYIVTSVGSTEVTKTWDIFSTYRGNFPYLAEGYFMKSYRILLFL